MNTTNATNHRIFARLYEALSHSSSERAFMDPLRQETAGQAHGLVLEIGAGNGLNFAFYDPAKVERVEAIEPDTTMLGYADQRAKSAPVSIHLTQAAVENIPFANATFDSAVATLVFCSVADPLRGLQEIQRVLKPHGTLFMVEHVRSQHNMIAHVQGAITPITRLLSGNCHWNRDTTSTVTQAGFHITAKRELNGIFLPMVVLQASFSTVEA